MAHFMVAAYSLRIRKLYEDIKDRIPGMIPEKDPGKSQRRIWNRIQPHAMLGYWEGVDFARAWVGVGKKPPARPAKIPAAAIGVVAKEFKVRVEAAEAIRAARLEAREKAVKALNGRKRDRKETGQHRIIRKEFENAVKRATNRAIIHAGQLGQQSIFQKASK